MAGKDKSEVSNSESGKNKTFHLTSVKVKGLPDPILADRNELVKSETLRRRKLRIQQVREQAKEAAKNVRERGQKECKKNEKDRKDVAEGNKLQRTKQMLKELREVYKTSVELIGSAHFEAAEQPDEAALQKSRLLQIQERARARGIDALHRQKKLDDERKKEATKIIRSRSLTRNVEDVRSKMIAALPPPKTGNGVKIDGFCASLSDGFLMGNSKSSMDTVPNNPPPSPASFECAPVVLSHPWGSLSESSLNCHKLKGDGKRAVISSASHRKKSRNRDEIHQGHLQPSRRKQSGSCMEGGLKLTASQIYNKAQEKTSIHTSERVVPSKTPPVILYDRTTHTEQSYRNPPGLVERVDPSSQPDARTVAAAESVVKNVKVVEEERAKRARNRGSVAIGRYRAHRDLVKLVEELNAINRERSKRPQADVFVPDFKREQRIKDRQNQLNASFERLLQLCSAGKQGEKEQGSISDSLSPLCLNLADTPPSTKSPFGIEETKNKYVDTPVQTDTVCLTSAPQQTSEKRDAAKVEKDFTELTDDLLSPSDSKDDRARTKSSSIILSSDDTEGVSNTQLVRQRGGKDVEVVYRDERNCGQGVVEDDINLNEPCVGVPDPCTSNTSSAAFERQTLLSKSIVADKNQSVNITLSVEGQNGQSSEDSTDYRDPPHPQGRNNPLTDNFRESMLEHFLKMLLEKKRGLPKKVLGGGNCCPNRIKVVVVDSSDSDSGDEEKCVCKECQTRKRLLLRKRKQNMLRCRGRLQCLRREVENLKCKRRDLTLNTEVSEISPVAARGVKQTSPCSVELLQNKTTVDDECAVKERDEADDCMDDPYPKRDQCLHRSRGMFKHHGGVPNYLGEVEEVEREPGVNYITLVLDPQMGLYKNPENGVYYMEHQPTESDSEGFDREDVMENEDSFLENVNELAWDPVTKQYYNTSTSSRYAVQIDQTTCS